MSLEAAEQIANMMVMDPYPGYEGRGLLDAVPQRACPSRVQKPHPPMWMACTNRDTIKVAARNGLGALAFSFLDPEEARTWVDIYYGIIKSEECVPLGHRVNANIAMVSGFSLHDGPGRGDPARPGGLRVLRLRAQRAGRHDTVPGRSPAVGGVPGAAQRRRRRDRRGHQGLASACQASPGIGTPAELREHMHALRGRRRRPGDLPPAGRPQPARATSARRSSCSPATCCPSSRPRPRARGPQGRGARAVTSQAALARKSGCAARRRRDPRRPRLRRQARRSTNPPPDRARGYWRTCASLSATWRADQLFVRPSPAAGMNSRGLAPSARTYVATPVSSYASPVPSRSCIARAVVRSVPQSRPASPQWESLDGSLGALPPAASAPVASNRDVEHTIRRVRMGGLRLGVCLSARA